MFTTVKERFFEKPLVEWNELRGFEVSRLEDIWRLLKKSLNKNKWEIWGEASERTSMGPWRQIEGGPFVVSLYRCIMPTPLCADTEPLECQGLWSWHIIEAPYIVRILQKLPMHVLPCLIHSWCFTVMLNVCQNHPNESLLSWYEKDDKAMDQRKW